MIDLVVLAGPTAVGKSDISIKIAQKIKGEIISADSMQIYKHMDIGSAKISKEEMKNIPHYMIDIADPKDSFNVSQYKELAEKYIEDIVSRGKIPMLVGGTGLYIDSIIKSYSFTEAEHDEEYRVFLNEEAKNKGNDYVHSLLKEVDIESYKKLHPNNLKRVIRALEIFKLTGKTMSEFTIENEKISKQNSKYNVKYFVLTMDREKLYDRINARVDLMIENGLIDEVKKLKQMGLTSDMQSMKGIGYKEILYYLDGNITLEEAIYLIKKGSRNYAKRQLTWFRAQKDAVWIDKDLFLNEEEITERILSAIK